MARLPSWHIWSWSSLILLPLPAIPVHRRNNHDQPDQHHSLPPPSALDTSTVPWKASPTGSHPKHGSTRGSRRSLKCFSRSPGWHWGVVCGQSAGLRSISISCERWSGWRGCRLSGRIYNSGGLFYYIYVYELCISLTDWQTSDLRSYWWFLGYTFRGSIGSTTTSSR